RRTGDWSHHRRAHFRDTGNSRQRSQESSEVREELSHHSTVDPAGAPQLSPTLLEAGASVLPRLQCLNLKSMFYLLAAVPLAVASLIEAIWRRLRRSVRIWSAITPIRITAPMTARSR